MSGHSPIYVKIDLAKANNPPERAIRNPRLNWSRSSSDQIAGYVEQLADELSQHEVEQGHLHCNDLLCCDRSHTIGIDNFTQKSQKEQVS